MGRMSHALVHMAMLRAQLAMLACFPCLQAGDASGTAVFDTKRRCWDPKAMILIDDQLHTFFPELVAPNEVWLVGAGQVGWMVLGHTAAQGVPQAAAQL